MKPSPKGAGTDWQSPPSEHDQLAWCVERIEQLERVHKAAKAVIDFEYPKIGSERKNSSRIGQAVWIHLRRALEIAEVSPE